MLGKLLKYDLKSVWRIWWIAAVSALGASFVGSFSFRFFLSSPAHNMAAETVSSREMLVTALAAIVFAFSVITIVASVLITAILVYLRFYKHFFSDEGYLTFTLPVSRKMLLFSKTLNAIIWTVAHTVLITVCSLVFLVFSPPATPETGFFNPFALEAVGDFISNLFDLMGAGWFLAFSFAGFLILTGLTVFSISLIHYCITLGAIIAKKAKLLVAIGMYYLITTILSFVAQAVIMVFFICMAGRFVVLFAALTPGAAAFAVWLIVLMVATVIAVLASIMYFLTLGNLERKLNLA